MILHLFKWDHWNPLSSLLYDSTEKNNLLPQLDKPCQYIETRIKNYIPTSGKYIFIIHNNNTTVFLPSSSKLSGTAWHGWVLPSTNSTANKMTDDTHQSAGHSFPNGWGLWGQNIHPGNVHMLCQMDMDLSRQIYQEEKKTEVMWSFHDFTIWRICQNLST